MQLQAGLQIAWFILHEIIMKQGGDCIFNRGGFSIDFSFDRKIDSEELDQVTENFNWELLDILFVSSSSFFQISLDYGRF